MHWININIDALQSMEFKRSNPTKRATWLSLLGYCCQHETGGRITGCRDWSDREWLQVCGVTKEEVLTDSLLCTFDGDDLLVAFYPLSQEQAIRAKREAGKKGGRPRKIDAPQSPELQAKEPCGLPDGSDSLKRKGKEGKGKEGKEKNTMSDEASPAENGEGELFGEANTDPETDPESEFLEALWNASPGKSRNRSSKKEVKQEWRKIPKKDRPPFETVMESLLDWARCPDWTKEGGKYATGLHRWIKACKWESSPDHTPEEAPKSFADQRRIAAEQSNACG